MVDSKEFSEPETIVNRLRGNYAVGQGDEFGVRNFSDSGFIKPINLEAARRIEQLEAENKRLKDCLNDIQNQCVGDLAMGYRLDAEDLGRMIYEKTGIKQGLGWKP